MYVGVAYYPEHWQRRRWPVDARLMQRAGFNVVRLAEFAWKFMEPEEGRFEFGWLDDALDVLRRRGIAAILCTPTAAMPAWVPAKYPEVMAMQKDGTRLVWGVRKNNCFSSAKYRDLSVRITRAMAEHFAGTPNVIGWQTDNEFGHPVCYCPSCRAEFQVWLKERYGTLAALNRAWGTHFWGQCYGAWEEIALPVDPAQYNPSLCLDWQRFFSWQNVRFQREQVAILRAVCPRHFVTHNFMGLFSDLNYYDLAADLDHVSWDNYPVWGAPEVRYVAAMGADVMRGLKRRNFWIMEQTAGPGGWGTFGRNPWPGELRNVAYQQLARGAEGMLWFRWRTCTAGREQYWHGLLGHDGRPLRRYREAAATAREFHKLAPLLAGTTVRPQVAMLYDYNSIWALRFQPGYPKNNYHDVLRRYYDALFRAGIGVDMVRPGDSLRGYRLVLAPDLFVLPDDVARKLAAFVAAGGVLVTDSRSGVKDETNLCHARTLPGLLRDVLGIEIQEYEALADDMQYPAAGAEGLGEELTAIHVADWVIPRGAETLVRYRAEHMRRYAAVTRHRWGRGWGCYLGTVFKEAVFYDRFMALVLAQARVRPVVAPPPGVEVVVREGRGRRLLFLINHQTEAQQVTVPPGKRELLSGRRTGTELRLPAFGVAVIRL